MATQAISRNTAAEKQPGRADWPPAARLWLLATASLLVAATAHFSRILTVDSFYDLFAGRYVTAHGIPHQNVVTVAAHGAPWIDQQWLAQVLYYGSWAAGGYPALAILAVGLTACGFSVLAIVMLRAGASPSRAFTWTIAAFLVAAGSYQIQAQDFGYLLFALTLALVLADSRKPRLGRRTWLVVAVLVLWANLHGSVLLGAGLTASYAAYRAVRAVAARDLREASKYLFLGLAAVAAVLGTPYGTGVISYYRRFIGNPELAAYISRWGPPNPRDPATWIFFAVVGAIVTAVVVAWIRGGPPDPVLAAMTLIGLALALRAAGNECWCAFAGCLLAADSQARAVGQGAAVISARFSAAVAALMTALAAAGLAALALTSASQFEGQAPSAAIARAASLVARDPRLHILGDAYSGTAMLWLEPRTPGHDGFDARLEQYPSAQLRAYFDFLFVRGPRWQRVTQGYGVIVVSRQSVVLARDLASLPGWRIGYADSDGIVFVRRPAA